MSILIRPAKLTRDDVLPGHVLACPTLEDVGMTEDLLAVRHLRRIGRACVGHSGDNADTLLSRAETRVAAGHFNYMMPGWVNAAVSPRSLPLLFYLCLRRCQPDMTRQRARDLFKDAEARGDDEKLVKAVYELWGIAEADPAPPPARESDPPAPAPSPSA
jgi:hypothetical protein